MTAFCDQTLTENSRALDIGAVSSVELTRAYLDRIDAVDGELGCFLHVDHDGAIAQARIADDRRKRGEAGPLTGMPIALKDALVTAGTPTTAGSKILHNWIPPYDGTVVSRLRQSGAVMLGKLNMDEFAMGSSTENSAYRVCKNPWDRARVPGGSSGGSAAAVAAGLCAASLGTDTGGSIRQPAALCGTVGFKPTYGRVSRYGVVAFASSLDQVGPLGRTVEDTALMLEAICGHDPKDSTSLHVETPRFRQALTGNIEGLRVGLPAEYFTSATCPEVAGCVDAAIKTLEHLGAVAVPIKLPHTAFALPTYYFVACAEASSNLARYDGIRYGVRAEGATLLETYDNSRSSGFGDEVKRRILLGTFALRSGYYDEFYGRAQKVRTLIKGDFDSAFKTVDVIASPVSPTAAFELGARTTDPLEMYQADTFSVGPNLAGLPALSVPCGFTSEGLPVGMQLVSRALDESTLLRAAHAYESATEWNRRRPEMLA